MENIQKLLRDIPKTFGLPEMRIFWFALPLFVGLFAVAIFGSGIPGAVRIPVVLLFVLAALAAVFWTSYRLASASSGSRLEHGALKRGYDVLPSTIPRLHPGRASTGVCFYTMIPYTLYLYAPVSFYS